MLRAEQVINLLVPDNSYLKQFSGNEYIHQMVKSIAELAHKIKHSENESIYFNRGLENKKKELNNLINKFYELQQIINQSSTYDFEKNIEKNKLDIHQIEKCTGSMFFKHMALSNARGKINTNELYKSIKKQVGIIEDLEYYLSNRKGKQSKKQNVRKKHRKGKGIISRNIAT